MKVRLLITTCCLLFLLPETGAADEAKFFPENGTHFGVYYYPEHWPEGQWERDIKRVAQLGFDFIHYGEFAWARLEPEDGKFDFAWMDEAVKLAADNGLKVLMSTPSPCPPAWLATKHPEVLTVDSSGKRTLHQGSRLDGSLANPVYRKYVARIAAEVAKRYGKDGRVWGWQIGNEPHIQSGEDYSPSAVAVFRAWLKRKYGTVEKLNGAWGASFWSYTLNDFEQVNVPTSNPRTYLDFQTYTSEEIARDLIDQARIVRQHSDGRQWITTNYAYFKGLKNVDPFLTRGEHDFASYTMYLTHNRMNSADDADRRCELEPRRRGFRQGRGRDQPHREEPRFVRAERFHQLEQHGFSLEPAQRDGHRRVPSPFGLGHLAAHLHLLSGAETCVGNGGETRSGR